MSVYVKINDIQYKASITGRMSDDDWGGRASKAITLEMTYNEAASTFVDDVNWFILQDFENIVERYDEDSNQMIADTVMHTESYDNSDYSISGSITDNRDGTVTVKLGKPTAEELLSMIEEVL